MIKTFFHIIFTAITMGAFAQGQNSDFFCDLNDYTCNEEQIEVAFQRFSFFIGGTLQELQDKGIEYKRYTNSSGVPIVRILPSLATPENKFAKLIFEKLETVIMVDRMALGQALASSEGVVSKHYKNIVRLRNFSIGSSLLHELNHAFLTGLSQKGFSFLRSGLYRKKDGKAGTTTGDYSGVLSYQELSAYSLELLYFPNSNSLYQLREIVKQILGTESLLEDFESGSLSEEVFQGVPMTNLTIGEVIFSVPTVEIVEKRSSKDIIDYMLEKQKAIIADAKSVNSYISQMGFSGENDINDEEKQLMSSMYLEGVERNRQFITDNGIDTSDSFWMEGEINEFFRLK